MPAKKQNPNAQSPFGRRMSALRKEQRLNMEQLARAMAVSKSYISLLEAGERQPSREVVLKLAQVLADQSAAVRDELLILAGFAPVSQEHIQLYRDLVSTCEAQLSQNPEDFSTYLRLIYALIKSGRFALARERIQQGLQRFALSVQLQALLATLELSQENYAAALLHQETALRAYQLQPQSETQGIQLADLEFNLGAIYFLRGYAQLNEFLQQADTALRQAALEDFAEAACCFERALALAPADLFIRDEYARLNFNRAFLLEPAAARPYWELTIQSFRQVLTSERKQELGQQTLMESSAFLAHAYTKSGRYEEAELILGLLESFQPGFWLPHYLQACFYSLRFQANTEQTSLERSLSALQQALATGNPVDVMREARQDPDLEALRQGLPAAFAQLTKGA